GTRQNIDRHLEKGLLHVRRRFGESCLFDFHVQDLMKDWLQARFGGFQLHAWLESSKRGDPARPAIVQVEVAPESLSHHHRNPYLRSLPGIRAGITCLAYADDGQWIP